MVFSFMGVFGLLRGELRKLAEERMSVRVERTAQVCEVASKVKSVTRK